MRLQEVLGKNVRKYRLAKGWSQEELAEETGLHRTYVSGVERGIRNPTVSIVERFADALGVKSAVLLENNT